MTCNRLERHGKRQGKSFRSRRPQDGAERLTLDRRRNPAAPGLMSRGVQGSGRVYLHNDNAMLINRCQRTAPLLGMLGLNEQRIVFFSLPSGGPDASFAFGDVRPSPTQEPLGGRHCLEKRTTFS